jgi:D-alanyl-lipoteichoic acid acyltransferase DltB (MBOAT superfamily)
MLFNSYTFIFLYLPVTLIGFFWISRSGRPNAAMTWLALASLFFYGWWDPRYVPLLVASIVFNYKLGMHLARLHGQPRARRVLLLGIAGDLALLGHFKYAGFFVANTNTLLGSSVPVPEIVLPLGISFFTFTQIAFLVDAYRGEAREYSFRNYTLFVTFFPHLIAGPILHHKEMMPQFARPGVYRLNPTDMAVGLTIFAMGLFKKVILADGIAVYVAPVFDAAAAGQPLTLVEAWGGALAYTLQLYFDFSGYSDMAIGLARFFGILMPLNFNSPYKATSVIEFWRRWHMTLSRFLRDYLYIPLGGNRKGPHRRYVNLMLTMLLGGLWHGAGWTFVLWGGMHGLYLAVNHAWRGLVHRLGVAPGATGWVGRLVGTLLTFLAVVISWVFFRAGTPEAALAILQGMVGAQGYALTAPRFADIDFLGLNGLLQLFFLELSPTELLTLAVGALLAWVWLAPNTQEVMARFRPGLETLPGDLPKPARLAWHPHPLWATAGAVLGLAAILQLTGVSEFLYFQF